MPGNAQIDESKRCKQLGEKSLDRAPSGVVG
jgi:hypothetical protein